MALGAPSARMEGAFARGTRRRAIAHVLRIPERATTFEARGFAETPAPVRVALELHGLCFADGFNSAVREADGDALEAALEAFPREERGFAYEGAAMGVALLDLLTPWSARRFAAFLRRESTARHVYMAHVGAGWALARLRRRPWGGLPLDPLLRWLALDGYGFHQAFFRPGRYVRSHLEPAGLPAGGARIFDQGVGRALWFVEGADPDRIARTIESFPAGRRPDLWSGAGLAATYAGAVTPAELERLRALAEPFELQLAQGAAFAAAARLHAGNVVPHTEEATRVLCGLDVEAVAAVTDRARAQAAGDTAADYERWRTAIRSALRRVPVPG